MTTKIGLAITATQRAWGRRAAAVEAASARWQAPVVANLRMGMEMAEAVIVFEASGVRLCDGLGDVRFSHGMAALRAGRVSSGGRDALVEAVDLRAGDRVLDGTLGLGRDALVAAAAVGPTGSVTGVESALPLAALVAEGLALLPPPWRSAPLRIRHDDVRRHLEHSADRYDVVIFDGMFRTAKRAHPEFELVRRHAQPAPVDDGLLQLARRRANRAVAIKVGHSRELADLHEPLTIVAQTRTATWAIARPTDET